MKAMELNSRPTFVRFIIAGAVALFGMHMTTLDASAGIPVSDDFTGDTEAKSFWRFDPGAAGGLEVGSDQASISVPEGTEHRFWSDAITVPRLLQDAPAGDFLVEVRFDSMPAEKVQAHGIIVQESDDHALRFETYHDGSMVRLLAVHVDAGAGTADVKYNAIAELTPSYLQVERSGDEWTYRASEDGESWTEVIMFSQSLNASEVGVYAANPSDKRAYTAIVDYFLNPNHSVYVAADGDDGHVGSESEPFATIQKGLDAVGFRGTVRVAAGTYVEDGQLIIDKDLSIVGADKETTIIKPAQDTGSGGEARGWFVVQAGVEFNLSNVTLDGAEKKVHQAIRSLGSGTIDNNIIRNMVYGSSLGIGVVVMGDHNMTVRNNVLSNFGRTGIMAFGPGVDNAQIIGNTITGKGEGEALDYGIDIGGGAFATITGNTISHCGPSSSAWSSAAIMLDELYAPAKGTGGADITGNTLVGNQIGIFWGNDETCELTGTIEGNTFSNNLTQVRDRADFLALDAVLAANTFDRAAFVHDSTTGDIKVLAIFSSIQDAIDAADPGDTIQVAAGTYQEDLDVQGSSGLTLLGPRAGVSAGPAGPRDDTSTDGEAIVIGQIQFGGGAPTVSDLTIDGFRLEETGLVDSGARINGALAIRNTIAITHSSTLYFLISVGTGSGHSLELTDSNVTGRRGFSIENGHVISALIRDNVFNTTAASLVSASANDGVVTVHGNEFNSPRGLNLLTHGNTITDNVFNTPAGAGNRGMDLYETENNIITGNTFSDDALGILVRSGGRRANPDNNTIENNTFGADSFQNDLARDLLYGANTLDSVKFFAVKVLANSDTVEGFLVRNLDSGDVFHSIQMAINAASSSNTVQVAAGTFEEGIHIPNGLDNLTLLGANAGIPAGAEPEPRGDESVIRGRITTGSGDSGWSKDLTVDGFTIKADRAFNGLRTQGAITLANNIIDGLNPSLSGSGNYAISTADSDHQEYELFILGNSIRDARLGFHYIGPSLSGGSISGNRFSNLLTAIGLGGRLDGIYGNEFTANEHGIVLVDNEHLDTNVIIAENRFAGNTKFAVLNQSTDPVYAAPNWWGDASGPYHGTENPDGEGDTVSDLVIFSPWLDAASYASWDAPDFTFTSVEFNPENPTPGEIFQMWVTVTNQGSRVGHAGHVYLWSASPYEAEDAIRTSSLGALEPGEQTTRYRSVRAPDEPGWYNARAEIVTGTPEKSKGNNHRWIGYTLGEEGDADWKKPDFIITEVEFYYSDAPNDPFTTPELDEIFRMRVTVKNQGDIAGDAGEVLLWSAGPYEKEHAVVISNIGDIAPDQTRTVSRSVRSPDEPGTYTARAEVVTDTPEKSKGNNHRLVKYVLGTEDGDSWGKPDFIVTDIVLDPAPKETSKKFGATVTIKNQGDIAGDAGVLRVWVSKSGRAEPGETGDGEVEVGSLEVGETRQIPFTGLNTTTNAGWHHFRAFVDADNVVDEKSEGNNQISEVYRTRDISLVWEENPDGAGYKLQWNSRYNWTYTIKRTTDLMMGFEVLETGVEATPPTNTYIDEDPPGGPTLFYMIDVE